MKTMTVILGILASAIVLSSCASNTSQNTVPAQTSTHHDYKGEKI